jgi:hypothetical protein
MSTYPEEKEFATHIRFIRRFNPRLDGAECIAQDELTGTRYQAYIGGEKIFEIENNIRRGKRNILDQPFPITSFERFAWVLFCKLKQKREI